MRDIISNHIGLAQKLNSKIKPLQHFDNYVRNGYYPFFQEAPGLYFQRLEEIVNLILEIELPLLRKVDIAYVNKLKQLLQIIAQSVPFMPNISKLSANKGNIRETFFVNQVVNRKPQ